MSKNKDSMRLPVHSEGIAAIREARRKYEFILYGCIYVSFEEILPKLLFNAVLV